MLYHWATQEHLVHNLLSYGVCASNALKEKVNFAQVVAEYCKVSNFRIGLGFNLCYIEPL